MVAAQLTPDLIKLAGLRVLARETQPARNRLLAFGQRIYPGYMISDHIERLVDELTRAVTTPDARLIVVMPPRHSKSVHVSENLPAWYLGNWPDNRVIASSHSQALANTFSRRVRAKFSDPRWPFIGVRIADDKGAVEAWDIANRLGGYAAVGVGGSPTGLGANLIIIDDPIRNAADAGSETIRESQWEWYTGTMRTRLEPGGSIIVTATRWHDDDLIGRLLAAQSTGGEHWRVLHMPALSDTGDALWPDRYDIPALEAIRATVGSSVFTAQYQGNPVPNEGGIFKRSWWQRYADLPGDIVRVEVTVDSAFKTGVGNDYSVCAAWARDMSGNAYLVRVWRKRVEFPELIALGIAAWRWARDAFPTIAVSLVPEDKASGQSAIQVWQDVNDIPVVPYHVGAGESKISRAEAVTPFVEGGRVLVPDWENLPSTHWIHEWLDEHDRFPHGKHDDQVDTSSIAITRLLLHGDGTFNALPQSTLTFLSEVYDQ
jgi:predicted phage terminase large subunit-like protein